MQGKGILSGLGGLLLVGMSCGGGSTAFKEARRAEARKDWDTALVKYEKALQSEPENASYLLHETNVRTHAADFHLRQGRKLLASGRLDEAAGEFQKAASIDPTNQAASQELARVLAQQAASKKVREESLQEALKAREQTTSVTGGVVKLKPLPPEPLAHFRISADSRKVYETLGKLADLNVAFTSDFQPKPVSVDLTSVKIEDALRILAFQTKTFWRPLTTNTILVIPDNPTNRRDYDEEVLKTIYISNPLAPADRTAITTALKQVLGLQRIVDNPDSNAIIVRDTPAKVAAAERMIRDLDRGKAEILLDVAVVEADRSRVRDLGLTMVPTSPLQATNIAGLGFNPASTVTVGGTSIPALPLNRLTPGSKDFSVVLPGAVANALLSDSHTHVLQNPQVRVTDGLTAKLRIGTRIPYATGSFLPSFGGTTSTTGGGLGLLASTQFQYQDVGVNLDITPRLMASGEVALHATIEISSLGANITIGGFSQPTFGQRKIEHDIRLKEGEVNLLGGLIQTSETVSVSGLPGLSQIPFLRYLFSTEHRDQTDTEVLVMLTPRVIRLPELGMGSGEVAVTGGGAPGSAPPPAFPGITPQPVPEVPQQPEGPAEAPGQPQP
ncbi:MAG: secretin N-terminal domain-containing protein [Terriglobia bacterium]|jgi:general secretion pathway protein D